MTEKTYNVGIYCRLSNDDERDGESVSICLLYTSTIAAVANSIDRAIKRLKSLKRCGRL